jgi:hypothetical protein
MGAAARRPHLAPRGARATLPPHASTGPRCPGAPPCPPLA